MKIALRTLLNRLDEIRKEHPELGQRDLRAPLAASIYHGFIIRTPGYSLPESLGLVSPEGNAAVRIAIAEFLDAAASSGARTPEQRYAAFQDATVESDAGHCYEKYFGYAPSFEALTAAMSRRPAAAPSNAPKPGGTWWQFWKQSTSRPS